MERVVTLEEGKRKAEMWNAVFIETTAKEHEVNGNKMIEIAFLFN